MNIVIPIQFMEAIFYIFYLLVHKQIFEIQISLRRFQPSKVNVTFECLFRTTCDAFLGNFYSPYPLTLAMTLSMLASKDFYMCVL